ncbi:MAG TPA: gluconate 2-dehydrogenase subunit 3 family protein [Xanthobacteraceae bacterium]
MSEKDPTGIARREVLKQIATAAGTAPLAPALIATVGTAAAATTTTTVQAQTAPASAPQAAAALPAASLPGYQSLGPEEAAFVETLVNVMCPADHLTPNGVDCGLALFIDRQLAGGFGQGERLYMQGPWRQGKPQFGYQLPMTPEQFFKAGIAAANAASRQRYAKAFASLPAADADAFLRDIASGKVKDARVPLAEWFNALVYPLFAQACYADPIYGGNRDKVFWQMIGYPGLPGVHSRDMVMYRGKPYPGAKTPKSIADFS